MVSSEYTRRTIFYAIEFDRARCDAYVARRFEISIATRRFRRVDFDASRSRLVIRAPIGYMARASTCIAIQLSLLPQKWRWRVSLREVTERSATLQSCALQSSLVGGLALSHAQVCRTNGRPCRASLSCEVYAPCVPWKHDSVVISVGRRYLGWCAKLIGRNFVRRCRVEFAFNDGECATHVTPSHLIHSALSRHGSA